MPMHLLVFSATSWAQRTCRGDGSSTGTCSPAMPGGSLLVEGVGLGIIVPFSSTFKRQQRNPTMHEERKCEERNNKTCSGHQIWSVTLFFCFCWIEFGPLCYFPLLITSGLLTVFPFHLYSNTDLEGVISPGFYWRESPVWESHWTGSRRPAILALPHNWLVMWH